MNVESLSQGDSGDKRAEEFYVARIFVRRYRPERATLTELTMRLAFRIFLSSLFFLAGTIHLINPAFFLPIMPPWLPIPFFLVQFSGICELTGGLGLLLPFRQVQFVAGWGLVLLLIAVFPANIYMAIAHVKIHGFPPEPWMAWARLLLQPLLIGAVLWTTNLLPGKETSKVS